MADTAISVIIPTRDRPDRLQRCLEALSRQTFDRSRFEVIIVDDGSAHSLAPIVAQYQVTLTVRLLTQVNTGPAGARTAGAALAKGHLLAFTDDDCEPEPAWLATFDAAWCQWPDALLGGCSINALPDNVYSVASQLLLDYIYAYQIRRATASPSTPPAFFTSNNIALDAARFRALGGFDTSFPLAAGEDRELCDRWQRHGHRLQYVPNAVVRHSHALTWSRFLRQHTNYGRGAYHLRLARVSAAAPRMSMEPLSFYAGLVAYPFHVRSLRQAMVLSGLMVVAQVANAKGCLGEWWSRPSAGTPDRP